VSPNPNHGVVYLLGFKRTISVSAVYDAAEYGSTKSQLDHWLETEHPDTVTRSPTILAGKPAEQAILRTGNTMNKVVVRRRNENDGILYELTLTTTPTDQAKNSVLCRMIALYFAKLSTTLAIYKVATKCSVYNKGSMAIIQSLCSFGLNKYPIFYVLRKPVVVLRQI
jgi:hypothetical protein